MPTVLHAADFHLSQSEQKYCFPILDELIQHVSSVAAKVLIFSGDTFDSPEDVDFLWEEFESRLRVLKGRCSVYIIPGNHDPQLPQSKFLNVVNEPSLIHERELELVFLPWPLADAEEFNLPPKKNTRICVAHGSMPELGFPELDYPLDTQSLLKNIGADFYCLGHIHAGGSYSVAGARFLYPGSMRVWRRKEYGPRTAFSIDTESAVRAADVSLIQLKTAGEYRDCVISLDDDERIQHINGQWNEYDYVHFSVQGLGRHQADKHELARQLAQVQKFRKVSFNFDYYFSTDSLPHPDLAKTFMQQLESMQADPEYKRTVLLQGMKALADACAQELVKGDLE